MIRKGPGTVRKGSVTVRKGSVMVRKGPVTIRKLGSRDLLGRVLLWLGRV